MAIEGLDRISGIEHRHDNPDHINGREKNTSKKTAPEAVCGIEEEVPNSPERKEAGRSNAYAPHRFMHPEQVTVAQKHDCAGYLPEPID